MKLQKELLKDIKKKKKSLLSLLPSIKSLFAGKFLFLIIFLILFTVSVFLYARFEIIPDPTFQESMIQGKGPYFESFYWLVTTATTVGYGDITPNTTEGKILALIVMVLGVSLLGFLLSQLTRSIVESNIGRFFGLNKIKKSIDYIVCGWNELSKSAFEEINDYKKSVIIISKNRPDLSFSKNVQYMSGDPKDKTILENANVMKAKNILLCMNNDSEILLAIHIIRELNPWINITAKLNDPDHIPMAESAGADQVVAPPAIAGRLLSIIPEQPYVVRWILSATSQAFDQEFVEYYVHEKSVFTGRTLASMREAAHIKIIGVESVDGFEKLPKDDYEIKTGDKLVVMVNKEEQ